MPIRERAEQELRKSLDAAYAGVTDDEELKEILIRDICAELEDIAKVHGEAGLRWLAESIEVENEWLRELLAMAERKRRERQ
ncbi:MAG: hypothetical protein K2H21_05310 [Muribaculaceae bacterium]|nr:hypothetical protein [Muribaculaceae bacterium]